MPTFSVATRPCQACLDQFDACPLWFAGSFSNNPSMPSAAARRMAVQSQNLAMKFDLQRQFARLSAHADKCTCALQTMAIAGPCETPRIAHDKTTNWRSGHPTLHATRVKFVFNETSLSLSAALVGGLLLPLHSNAGLQGTDLTGGEPPPSRPAPRTNRRYSHDTEYFQRRCDPPSYRRPHLWAPFCQGQPLAYPA